MVKIRNECTVTLQGMPQKGNAIEVSCERRKVLRKMVANFSQLTVVYPELCYVVHSV